MRILPFLFALGLLVLCYDISTTGVSGQINKYRPTCKFPANDSACFPLCRQGFDCYSELNPGITPNCSARGTVVPQTCNSGPADCVCDCAQGYGGLNCESAATGKFGLARAAYRACFGSLIDFPLSSAVQVRQHTIEFLIYIYAYSPIFIGSGISFEILRINGQQDIANPYMLSLQLQSRYASDSRLHLFVETMLRGGSFGMADITTTNGTFNLLLNRPVHIAITSTFSDPLTVDNPINVITIYVDGNPIITVLSNRAITLDGQTATLGVPEVEINQVFKILIDEFRIWMYPKSQLEIWASMSKPLTPTQRADPRLLVYYNFDNDTLTDVRDSSTYGVHGVGRADCVSQRCNDTCNPQIIHPISEYMGESIPSFTAPKATIDGGEGLWNMVELPQMERALFGHTLTHANGILYSIGGNSAISGSMTGTNKVLAFDLLSSTWSDVTPPNAGAYPGLFAHTAHYWTENKIITFGSGSSGNTPVRIYDMFAGTITPITLTPNVPLEETYVGHGSVMDGTTLYVFGGATDIASFPSSDLLIIDTETWNVQVLKDLPGPSARATPLMTEWNSTHLALYGGINSITSLNALSDLWVFEKGSHRWTPITQPPPGRIIDSYARKWFGGISLGDRSMLAFSGVVNNFNLGDLFLGLEPSGGTVFTRDTLGLISGLDNDYLLVDALNIFPGVAAPLLRFGMATARDSAGNVYISGGLVMDNCVEDNTHVRAAAVAHFYKVLIPGCSPGQVQLAETSLCVSCSAGTYSDTPHTAYGCSKCLGTSYGPLEGATQCLECTGTTRTEQGSDMFTICDPPVIQEALTPAQIFGIVFGVVVVAVGGGLGIFFYRRKFQQERNKQPDIPLNIDEAKFDQVSWLSKDDLQFGEELGSGSFGSVYKGTYQGKDVAIKVSKPSSQQGAEDFLKEAGVMRQLKPHPNVLQLIGVAIGGSSIYMVLEFINGGSLESALKKGATYLDEDLRALLVQICRGLQHLHSSNLIHRDLAARNILLQNGTDGSVTAKISDFGMSRTVDANQQGGQTVTTFGPIPWMSPEAIGELKYSVASDIWSLGIAIWEILTGSNPANQMPLIELAMEIRDNGFHPRIPPYIPDWLSEIFEGCWQKAPGDRISLNRILSLLLDSGYSELPTTEGASNMSVSGHTTNSTKKKKGGGGTSSFKAQADKLTKEVASLKAQLAEANAKIGAYERSGAVLPSSGKGWTKGDQRKSLLHNDAAVNK